jgi:hypothetical protein
LSEPDAQADDDSDSFEADDDDLPVTAASWPSAIGQMAAAVLVVLALVAAFIGGAAVLRRLLP